MRHDLKAISVDIIENQRLEVSPSKAGGWIACAHGKSMSGKTVTDAVLAWLAEHGFQPTGREDVPREPFAELTDAGCAAVLYSVPRPFTLAHESEHQWSLRFPSVPGCQDVYTYPTLRQIIYDGARTTFVGERVQNNFPEMAALSFRWLEDIPVGAEIKAREDGAWMFVNADGFEFGWYVGSESSFDFVGSTLHLRSSQIPDEGGPNGP